MPMSPRLLRPRATGFDPRSISGLALWLDAADTQTLYTTDAGPVTAVSSPLEIAGCKLWLDADDASTFTLASGNVSEWRDKSGSGVPHATQATSTARPARTASGLNGRAVVEFQPAHTLIFASSTASFNFLHNATGATVFFVLKPDATSNPDSLRYLLNNTNNSSSNTGVSIFVDDRSSVSRNNFLFASVNRGVNGQSTASVAANNFYAAMDAYSITSLTLDNGNATAASRLLARLNGAQDANVNSLTNAAATGNATLDMTIGNFGGLGAPAGIAEIIFYEGPLSAANRARVEMYLAAKWGISGVHTQATATNDPVGAWLDKSGNGRHATQGSAASRPTISATALNGKRQLGLVSQHFRGPSTTWNGSATIYWVGRTGLASNGAIAFHDGTVEQTDAFHAGWLMAQGVGAYGSGWGSGLAPRAESPSAWRNADIIAGVTFSSTEAIARVNGATTNTVAALTGTLSQSAAAQFWIGREASTWTNLNGSLAELLIYQPALNASQRLRLERYLAAKYGITLAPQVSNADAQDWINRVYANGGTVSATTATAVNTFCNDIENAGIRDRFYRLNLFCGNSDGNLNAVRTPLYRGPSRGGTQFGNTIDTNVNFVQGDYAETGASGGLTGTGNNGAGVGNTKHLRTGLQQSALATSNLHLSAFVFGLNGTGPQQSGFVGIRDNATPQNRWWLEYRGGINTELGGNGPGFSAVAVQTGNKMISCSRESNTLLRAYVDGAQHGADITTDISSSLANRARDWYVFAVNIDGDPASYSPFRMGMYSVGLTMTGSQMSAFNFAMSAFNTAMGRT
jgi:hypothetical protein